MEYELRPERPKNLPSFILGTAGTQLVPRPNRLVAAMQVPRGEGGQQSLSVALPGIQGPNEPVAKLLLFSGDWLVMPQPGYAYVMSASEVQTSEEPNEDAPLQVDREATKGEESRTTVAAITSLWARSGGNAKARVFGLRRVAPLYVYGQISPVTLPGKLNVHAGEYDVDPEKWLDPSPLLVSESDLRQKRPRIVPRLLLAREFARWERQNGELIEDFGLVD